MSEIFSSFRKVVIMGSGLGVHLLYLVWHCLYLIEIQLNE